MGNEVGGRWDATPPREKPPRSALCLIIKSATRPFIFHILLKSERLGKFPSNTPRKWFPQPPYLYLKAAFTFIQCLILPSNSRPRSVFIRRQFLGWPNLSRTRGLPNKVDCIERHATQVGPARWLPHVSGSRLTTCGRLSPIDRHLALTLPLRTSSGVSPFSFQKASLDSTKRALFFDLLRRLAATSAFSSAVAGIPQDPLNPPARAEGPLLSKLLPTGANSSSVGCVSASISAFATSFS